MKGEAGQKECYYVMCSIVGKRNCLGNTSSSSKRDGFCRFFPKRTPKKVSHQLLKCITRFLLKRQLNEPETLCPQNSNMNLTAKVNVLQILFAYIYATPRTQHDTSVRKRTCSTHIERTHADNFSHRLTFLRPKQLLPMLTPRVRFVRQCGRRRRRWRLHHRRHVALSHNRLSRTTTTMTTSTITGVRARTPANA